MILKKKRFWLITLLLLGALLIAGPRHQNTLSNSQIELLTIPLNEVDQFVSNKESNVHGIKEDNQARVIWYNDSLKSKTEYAVVYMHGFSASQGEGNPVHREFSKRYGCNLLLTRFTDHGVSGENIMENLTSNVMLDDAKEAIALGKVLGDKVILMSTSTGGTLALYLAAHNPELIDGLILYSPNIDLVNQSSKVLNYPWGISIARLINGGKKNVYFPPISKEDSMYWTKSYRLEGIAALRDLMKQTMTVETFENVREPVFMGYYFKDENNQDPVVSVDAMLEMYDHLGTIPEMKRKHAFAEVGRHVIASEFKSEDWQSVRDETYLFVEEIMNMKPVEEGVTSSLQIQKQ